MSKTFLQLRAEINASIWPSGVAENLADPLRDADDNVIAPAPLTMLYQEAMATIAKWVPCEQTNPTDVINFSMTYFKMGMTAISERPGVVKRIYTIAGGEWTDPVFYTQMEWPEPENWARNLLTQYQDPANALVLPPLPKGFKRAESTTDRNEAGDLIGRARHGIWAIHDRRIWVAPWIQSNEQLVVEWHGIKKQWNDDDLVNDDQDYRKAVKLYVQYGYERDYGDAAEAARIHQRLPDGRMVGTFDEALADLIHECRERTKVQKQYDQARDERPRMAAELEDDEVTS